jgi:three-Cys-motif partner protein
MNERMQLNEIQNYLCKKGCNREDRQEVAENDICIDVESIIDQLPVRCVGEWGIEKIYLLNQYFGIFSTGMKNVWKGEINYIEICSGPGRCINRKNGNEFDGTALSIARHKGFQYIKKAIFFDFSNIVVDTLNERFKNLGITKAKAYLGDYNNPQELCFKIRSEINSYSLNLVFIDPTDCSVPFSLIKEIKKTIPKADLIINVASFTDFNRNVKKALLNPDSHKSSIHKYGKFLDNDISFFHNEENINLAQQNNSLMLRKNFRELYLQKLKSIGYIEFEYKQIEHFYDILFTSEHKKGIEFWKKATTTDHHGQRSLDF